MSGIPSLRWSQLRIRDGTAWHRSVLIANYVEYLPLQLSAVGVHKLITRIKAEEEIWNKVVDEIFDIDALVHIIRDINSNASFPAPANDPGTAKLSISESALPVPVTVANGLTRRFVAQVPGQKTTWFLAGVATKAPRLIGDKGETLKFGDDPTAEADTHGTRVVLPQDGDKVLVLSASATPPGSGWKAVKKANGTYAVLLRLPENEKGATLEFTLTTWSLPKDEDSLIQGLK